VHRGRFGGNARKRKSKLTDATFHAMIGAPLQADVQGFLTQETGIFEVVIADREALNGDRECGEASSRLEQAALMGPLAEARRFACQDYEFGYAACSNCHNDQAFYIHRVDLTNGYTFRCRVCGLEMTVWAKS
jgi:hypothetical protein